MYSEHGLLALIGPALGHVCHALMVVSNCTPGSAQRHAALPICSHSSAAWNLLATCPVVRQCVFHSPFLSRVSKNASGMRTELLLFWPLTVWYASPLKS